MGVLVRYGLISLWIFKGSYIVEEELKHYTAKPCKSTDNVTEIVLNITKKIKAAKRPIIIAGQGVRLGKAITEFKAYIENNKIPYVASRLGIDLLPSNNELFIGRIGTKGDRAGNFAVQNSDLVLVIGSRLSVCSTGHEYKEFARNAEIIVIDIDKEEHTKNTVNIDKFIHADAKEILQSLNDCKKQDKSVWADKCLQWKKRWPVMQEEYVNSKNGVNLYHFIDELSKLAPDDSVFISDAGSAVFAVSQGIQLKEGQRYVTSGAQAEMGFSLPAAIGVAATGNKNVLAITGDGSLQMNIQEIQTVLHNKLPIKLFVWNNDGYLSIRATQRKFFEGRFIGTDSTSGVSFPNLEKISTAYGINYVQISNPGELTEKLRIVLEQDESVICEVMCIRDQEIIPTVTALKKDDGTLQSKPLEDMYPYLDRGEFNEQMIIDSLEKL